MPNKPGPIYDPGLKQVWGGDFRAQKWPLEGVDLYILDGWRVLRRSGFWPLPWALHAPGHQGCPGSAKTPMHRNPISSGTWSAAPKPCGVAAYRLRFKSFRLKSPPQPWGSEQIPELLGCSSRIGGDRSHRDDIDGVVAGNHQQTLGIDLAAAALHRKLQDLHRFHPTFFCFHLEPAFFCLQHPYAIRHGRNND